MAPGARPGWGRPAHTFQLRLPHFSQQPPLPAAPLPRPPVARELTKRGFGRVFVVSGGCDAWGAAKLRIKPWRTTGLLPAPAELEAAEVEVAEAEEANVMA